MNIETKTPFIFHAGNRSANPRSGVNDLIGCGSNVELCTRVANVMTLNTFCQGVEYNELTKPFVDDYMKRFGETPTYTAGTYSAIVYTLLPAIEKTATLNSDKLAAFLEHYERKTPSGTVKYTKDAEGRPLVLLTNPALWPSLYLYVARPQEIQQPSQNPSAEATQWKPCRRRGGPIVKWKQNNKAVRVLMVTFFMFVSFAGIFSSITMAKDGKEIGTNVVQGKVISVQAYPFDRGIIEVKSDQTGEVYIFYVGIDTVYVPHRTPVVSEIIKVTYINNQGQLKATMVEIIENQQ